MPPMVSKIPSPSSVNLVCTKAPRVWKTQLHTKCKGQRDGQAGQSNESHKDSLRPMSGTNPTQNNNIDNAKMVLGLATTHPNTEYSTESLEKVKPAKATPNTKQGFKMSSESYRRPHLGFPCTIDCLDHVLSCGHKVITDNAEPCASNCRQIKAGQLPNPRNTDEPFACLACTTQDLGKQQTVRAANFQKELEHVAHATRKTAEWIRVKLAFLERAWKDLHEEELLDRAKKGRFCRAPWVEPEFQDMVSRLVVGNGHLLMMDRIDAENRSMSASPKSLLFTIEDLDGPLFRKATRTIVHRGKRLPIIVHY